MIQERFNQLQPYLRGIRLADKFVIVECFLKQKWKVTELIPEESNIQLTAKENKEATENGQKYYMLYATEYSIDSLVDFLEYVINTNIEIEQKEALLRSKVDELKKMFESKPLDELKNLKFTSDIDVTLNVNKPEQPETKVTKEEVKKENNVVTEKV